MLSLRTVMALLAVLALSAEVAESAVAAPDVCSAADAGKSFCLNCKTKAKCMTADSAPEPRGKCTVAGEACTVISGVAICLPLARTACSCAKRAQCDAYDPASVLVCLSGGLTVSTNCFATQKTCVDGACALPPTPALTDDVCVGAPDGFAVVKPMCTTAAYCSDGTSAGTTDCGSGTYFDMDKLDCLPLPPGPCAGCGTGVCPDKSDCSKWYICDGGAVLYKETCAPATPVFDINAKECQATGTCTGNDGCTYGTTTAVQTTATTPSSSTAKSFPSFTATTNPSSTATTVPSSTATPVPSSTATSVPSSTATPVPSSTATPVPSSTATTVPSSTATPVPSSTATTVPSSTATTVPSSTATIARPTLCTATNVGQRYTYEGNCKKYRSCRRVSSAKYDYVESTCLGTLVFNAATGYCDTPKNVPGCVPPP